MLWFKKITKLIIIIIKKRLKPSFLILSRGREKAIHGVSYISRANLLWSWLNYFTIFGKINVTRNTISSLHCPIRRNAECKWSWDEPSKSHPAVVGKWNTSLLSLRKADKDYLGGKCVLLTLYCEFRLCKWCQIPSSNALTYCHWLVRAFNEQWILLLYHRYKGVTHCIKSLSQLFLSLVVLSISEPSCSSTVAVLNF